MNYNFFVDMDGVLCDFSAAVTNLGQARGIDDKATKADKTAMFKAIEKAGPNFWANMSWAPDGKELWDYLVKINPGKSPIILSSPGKGRRFIDQAMEGKGRWLRENLPGVPYHFEQEKHRYANRDESNVLIDDMKKNVDAWIVAGGTGIRHKSARETIAKVARLLAGERLRPSNEDLEIMEKLSSKGIRKTVMARRIAARTLARSLAPLHDLLRRLAFEIPETWQKDRERIRERHPQQDKNLTMDLSKQLQTGAADIKAANPNLFIRDMDRILSIVAKNPDPRRRGLLDHLIAFRNEFRPANPIIPGDFQEEAFEKAAVLDGGAELLEALRKLFKGDHGLFQPPRR